MARCQWCTAPLPPRSLLCRYCGKRSDVDLKGVHEYTVAKPESDRLCPACEVPMQTLDLHLGGAFYLERCAKCLSLFFDQNELETILEKSTTEVFQVDRQVLGDMLEEGGPAPAPVRYYKCPVCRTVMNRVSFGARSGVVVDQCPDHGLWLESGELRRLMEWKKAGGEILERRRREEREGERKQEHRRRARDLERLKAEAGLPGAGGGDEPLLSLPDPTDSVLSAVRLFLKLLGR